MRVAFDVTCPARVVTGVGVYARQLLEALTAGQVDIVRWQRRLGPPGRGRSGRAANALRLGHWLIRQAPQLAQVEAVSIYHAAGSLAPLGASCPVMMTLHDATLVTRRFEHSLLEHLFYRVFSVAAARRAAAIIVPTHASRERVLQAYALRPDRVHVVPYGVAPAFRPVSGADCDEALGRYGIARPYVLFVGADSPRKNLARLVAAFARVRRVHPDLSLVLAGPTHPRVARVDEPIARHGLEGAARRIGHVGDPDLPAVYSAASCLAYPSLEEGFGLPLLEAMACGTPVVTAAGTGTADVGGDAAILVDPASEAAIADGMLRLLADERLAAALVERGLRRSREFSWQRTAEGTERVYRSLCGAARLDA